MVKDFHPPLQGFITFGYWVGLLIDWTYSQDNSAHGILILILIFF